MYCASPKLRKMVQFEKYKTGKTSGEARINKNIKNDYIIILPNNITVLNLCVPSNIVSKYITQIARTKNHIQKLTYFLPELIK